MTRFVAALLIARGQVVTAQADPRAPGCGGLGDVQPSARLLRAFAEGRKQRAAGIEAVVRAGDRAWAARHQQQEGEPS